MPKVKPIYKMSQEREQLNRFNSTQTKQKKAIAEIIKSLTQVVAILFTNVCSRNKLGDNSTTGSCNNQNQGMIVPPIVRSKYRDFNVLDERVLERIVDFSMIIQCNEVKLFSSHGTWCCQ